MGGEIRVGRVSSVDYESGTYEVVYNERDQSVTKRVNAVANGLYCMPKIGQMVCVLHRSNGSASAISVGTVWNQANRPVEGKKGLYRRELSEEPGNVFERYDNETGDFMMKVNGVTISVDRSGNVSVDGARGMTVRAEDGITLVGKKETLTL